MANTSQRRIAFLADNETGRYSATIPEELIAFEDLREFAASFRQMTDEDCSILYDEEAKMYLLVHMQDAKPTDEVTIIGDAKAVDEETTSEPRIPRPPNAWIIYRSHKSKEIRKNESNVTAGYISTLASQMWKQETPAVRLLYNDKAIEAQRLHKVMYPDYKYNGNGKKAQ